MVDHELVVEERVDEARLLERACRIHARDDFVAVVDLELGRATRARSNATSHRVVLKVSIAWHRELMRVAKLVVRVKSQRRTVERRYVASAVEYDIRVVVGIRYSSVGFSTAYEDGSLVVEHLVGVDVKTA